MLKIYHNSRCSKSRETLNIIKENNTEVEVIQYLNAVPTFSELTAILKMLDIPAEQLIRKGEPAYKEHFKGKSLDEKEWIEAMISYPKLIERPIVIKGNKAIIGRPPQKVEELL